LRLELRQRENRDQRVHPRGTGTASETLTVQDSTVHHNVAPSGADIYNLGALTLKDSTVGVIGP
jgi:hypothetical protein